MKHFWENDGEPNASGQYHAVIDLEDSSNPQHFYGDTHKEVADKLMVAQMNASQRIRDLKGKTAPEPAPAAPALRPRALTADEQFRIAQDITDPTRAPGAIRTVVESAVGVPLDKLAERLSAEEVQQEAERSGAATKEFIEQTPEFYPCERNNRLLMQFMQNYVFRNGQGQVTGIGMRFTRSNLEFAFEQLQGDGLLTPRPATENANEDGEAAAPAAAERIAPAAATLRPRGAVQSTGIRNGDSSGVPGRRTAPKYTIADIDAMPEQEYAHKFANEAGFAQLVDALYAKPAASR